MNPPQSRVAKMKAKRKTPAAILPPLPLLKAATVAVIVAVIVIVIVIVTAMLAGWGTWNLTRESPQDKCGKITQTLLIGNYYDDVLNSVRRIYGISIHY